MNKREVEKEKWAQVFARAKYNEMKYTTVKHIKPNIGEISQELVIYGNFVFVVTKDTTEEIQ